LRKTLTTKDTSDWHALTQNDEYLKLSSQRLSEPPLIWVNQFTQIINDFIGENKGKYVINDIGCNVGHFARNVELINADIAYRGIDISKTYLEIAKHHFPKLDFFIEDFAQKELNIFQFESDISVVSATLEHIDDYEQFLSNIFKTTSQMVLIRTFIGETSEMDYCLKEGATQSYLIRQFVLSDLVNKNFNKDWLFEEIIDEATLNKPKVICNSITRSQQILKFVKK
jgi:2-polyprenyl-3-methyl-5-hydroxy-6-metoxy-1,4-benzoquinol methylase